MSNPVAKLDRSALLQVLDEVRSSVIKAEAYELIGEHIAKNVGLLQIDIARLRRSRAADAKIKMAILSGQLMAYKEMREWFDRQDD